MITLRVNGEMLVNSSLSIHKIKNIYLDRRAALGLNIYNNYLSILSILLIIEIL